MVPAKATYTPVSDITAYELSLCIKVIFEDFTSTIIDKDQFDMMDEGVKRHFVVVVLDPSITPPEDPGPLG